MNTFNPFMAGRKYFLPALGAFVLCLFNLQASDILQLVPLTNRVVLIHFDDGSVSYPNLLNVSRLDVNLASTASSYTIVSTDDADYASPLNPVQIGRKSKGTEFLKDAPWGGSSADPRTKPWASEHWIYLMLDKPLKAGKSYTVNTGLLAANGSQWTFAFQVKDFRSEAVHVNTIGYAADAPKYGYVYHWMGNAGGLSLSAYAGKKFWVYKEGVSEPVKQGFLKKRKASNNAETGQPNDSPDRNFLGAEVYECDFSDISADGKYSLVVEDIGSSYPFKIGKDALFEAYYKTARALYYQRSGIRLAPPYTDNGYIRPVNQNTILTSDDGTSFSGKLLYSDFAFTSWAEGDGGGSSQEQIRNAAIGKTLDVAGWYHDAGDWDSYYTHHKIPGILLLSWEAAPERFMDGDLNIPESGNGIPDIVDEASWLVKFNYRLRKELIAKGYSDGGVGGARICADVFTSVDGNAESTLPSWKEKRRTVVTQADAFMTYLYAAQAAHFAYVLKRIGKYPDHFPVEMLDQVDFSMMSRDTVNWIKEAKEAFAWASDPAHQPASNKNYSGNLNDYRMYAASCLFRLTGEELYHEAAKTELRKLVSVSNLSDEQRWGVYVYLFTDHYKTDYSLKNSLLAVVTSTARYRVTDAAANRACRWGGIFDMPMLVGQATTPWIFEALMAYALTGERIFKDAIHTTADYFLGTNPLNKAWATGLGPNPCEGGFHLDSRYNNNWKVYPGFVPYGPWSMAYGYTPYKWTIDGVEMEGGHGSWNKDWANFSVFPLMNEWPGHERWNNNIHAPMSTENTVHQNAVFAGLTYGFVNNRINTNAGSTKPVSGIWMNKNEIILSSPGATDSLVAQTNPYNDTDFPVLKWISSDPRIAYVDAIGRVTGVTSGNCIITCQTLDGSVSSICNVQCNWAETSVDSIQISPDSLVLTEGQKSNLSVVFFPAGATNKFVDWSYSISGIASVNPQGILSALAPGKVWVIATSLNGSKKDSCFVEVKEAVDYTIADFDLVVPVTTSPQPNSAQLYTPDGTNNIAAINPLKGSANPSEKVVQWNRPAGDWRLIGMVLATDHPQDLSQFAQFQFKYYGKGINDFLIQLTATDDSKIEINETVQGEECWQLYALNLASDKKLKQLNIFANKQGNQPAISWHFDDFQLKGKPMIPYDNISLSDGLIEISMGDSSQISVESEGNPFTLVSSDPQIFTIDQKGKIKALAKGIAFVKAVPLYGTTATCKLTVTGGDIDPSVTETKMILDFENYALDWGSGYGAFAWNSDKQARIDNPVKQPLNTSNKIFSWKRDGSATWAGFGIQFPMQQTGSWERFSMQIYSNAPLKNLRMEIMNGEVSQGAFELTGINIPEKKWTTVWFSIESMGAVEKSFNKVQLQPAGGSSDTMTVYCDNLQFQKGGIVPGSLMLEGSSSRTIELNKTIQMSLTLSPSNTSFQEVVWVSSDTAIATVSASGLILGKKAGIATITVYSVFDWSKKTTVTIQVQNPIGVEENCQDPIKIYPNPAKDKLFIQAESKIQWIDVISLQGKNVISLQGLHDLEKVIDISAVPHGVYLLKVSLADGSFRTLLFTKE